MELIHEAPEELLGVVLLEPPEGGPGLLDGVQDSAGGDKLVSALTLPQVSHQLGVSLAEVGLNVSGQEPGAGQEVSGERGRVGQTLEGGVHVASVAKVGQAHQPSQALVTAHLLLLGHEPGAEHALDPGDVVAEHDLGLAEIAPGSLVGDVELDRVARVVPVVLGGVIHSGLGAAQHIAVRVETQPEVGAGDPAPADVTLGVSEELGQVSRGQSAHTGGHVGTRAGHPALTEITWLCLVNYYSVSHARSMDLIDTHFNVLKEKDQD